MIESDCEGQLLTMDISQPEVRMGNKWPKLCHFLGLGYSIVERLHLRDFPKHENRKSWGKRVENVYVAWRYRHR